MANPGEIFQPGVHGALWVGLSSDAKPTAGLYPVDHGCYRQDVDTGTIWRYYQGTWYEVLKAINGKQRVSSMPYLYDIAEGHVSGHSGFSKIGFNGDVGTSEEDIWAVGGTFVPPASAMQMEVISSNAADSAEGTGARTVIVYYLDGDGAEQSETVTMNGTNAVATTATDIAFVNGFRVASAGTGMAAAGNIDIRHLTDTPVYSRIQAGYTRARNINYKVPSGKAIYITSVHFSVHSATKGVRFTTRGTYDKDAATIRTFFLPYTEVAMTNGAFLRPLEIPTYFPAGARIKVSAVADAAGAVCSCSIRGWIKDAA